MAEEEIRAELEALEAVYGGDCLVIEAYPPHIHIRKFHLGYSTATRSIKNPVFFSKRPQKPRAHVKVHLGGAILQKDNGGFFGMILFDFGDLVGAMEEERQTIYKISRTIKRRESSLYNALRSIYEDSIFIGEISQLWPDLALLANLRCGLWYYPKFHSNCYFKSTDGHTNNLSFSTSRLNLHVAVLAGQQGGCMIVDSTRKGKRFPDSMSKTIPIWTCVLNRAIYGYRTRVDCNYSSDIESATSNSHDSREQFSYDWDCSLHLPLWVSESEKAMIEKQLEGWTKELEASGADIASLAISLRKPLRPLWISQRTVIWLNEVPEYDSWDFTPIILDTLTREDPSMRHESPRWSCVDGYARPSRANIKQVFACLSGGCNPFFHEKWMH
ncbi:initiator tRNA phosphoribosyl transferase family protein [Striga asiatica]|uniref:Initiator tRNA phosphoribosyl transferase family protein n=1 Tax=Striga asiatica TaxID=4170 RepID=A0A5A7PN81_STRAF|nr:initiator tRNA phosphoribosyl transferase family protein [Striga asiatica]